jgi:3'-5' exoribonuclease|tara:strand:- start:6 stop:950 length:945 start_codon:yes stop_codon:yes gene_type:complete
MKLTQIIDFKSGRSIQGFFICKEKHLRYTRNGDLYLDLVLSDATGVIQSKMWDLVNDFQDRFNGGDPVAVKAKVGEFNDSLQLTITQINLASSEQYGKYGFSPDLLIKSVDESLDELWKRFSKLYKSIKKPLRELVSIIIKDNAEKIRTMPASVNHHHPVRGGFLKHLVTTGEMASDLLRHYPAINRDLVLAGIILHDIGKVKSINDDLIPSHTDEGKLIGHIVLGRDMLMETARKLGHIPQETLIKLEHIVLSHQGSPEKGSVTYPKFPEALMVHYIDQLDGRMTLMQDAIENDPNTDWTAYQSIFKSELYKK